MIEFCQPPAFSGIMKKWTKTERGVKMAKLDETLTMLKALTDAKGVPGNEREAREVMKTYIAPYADEVTTDGLGSLIAKKEGKAGGPKVMIAGHLDEVGFMVTQIDDKGFIRFQTLGGWWSQVMLATSPV